MTQGVAGGCGLVGAGTPPFTVTGAIDGGNAGESDEKNGDNQKGLELVHFWLSEGVVGLF